MARRTQGTDGGRTVRLRWNRSAAADRRKITEYIAANDPLAALSLDALFERKAADLSDHPGMGRHGRAEGTRELVVHKNYILVYRFTDTTVRILRVLHAAQQWP